jgi:hypothetical protein
LLNPDDGNIRSDCDLTLHKIMHWHMCFRPHIRLHRPPTPPVPAMNIPFDPSKFSKIKVLPCSSSSSVGRRRIKSKPPQAPKEPGARYEQYSQFTLFPKLPPEIRARIWCFTVQSPRVVEVHETDLVMFITNRPTPL